jgi:hypothetical protein
MSDLLDTVITVGGAVYIVDKLTGKRKRVVKNPPKKRPLSTRKKKTSKKR